MHRSKKYKENINFSNKHIEYNIKDACCIIKKMIKFNFDESIDISISVKKDAKKVSTKGSFILPHGNGKKTNVLLLIKDGDNNENLKKKYNADFIGGEDRIKDIENKKDSLNYHYIVTTPDMLVKLKKISSILGPKGIMPNSKNNTVTTDITKTIKDIHRGYTYFSINKSGILNLSIGRKSFENNKIYDNFKALFKALLKYTSIKNSFIKSTYLSTTMGPSIKIDINNIR